MSIVPGQGWGMPFIVRPTYVPQNPEYEKHYKPEQQGCADCNGPQAPVQRKFFSRDVMTCDGIKTIQTTKPPNTPPLVNREMDKQYLGIVPTLTKTSVIGRSTRKETSVDTIVFDITNDV